MAVQGGGGGDPPHPHLTSMEGTNRQKNTKTAQYHQKTPISGCSKWAATVRNFGSAANQPSGGSCSTRDLSNALSNSSQLRRVATNQPLLTTSCFGEGGGGGQYGFPFSP